MDVDSAILADLAANWGSVEEEACVATQTLSQMTDEAIACREDSSASNHQSNLAEERDASPALSSRWAERLLSLTREYNVQRPAAPINVVSGCTGISAESFVFGARVFTSH